jgi:hypothetical protein
MVEKEEALILVLGAVGTLADYATTQIGLRMGLTEINPLVNPILEGIFSVAGPVLINEIGKKLGVEKGVRLSLMHVPAAIPITVAISNVLMIATVNIREYPINQFPLLYWR